MSVDFVASQFAYSGAVQVGKAAVWVTYNVNLNVHMGQGCVYILTDCINGHFESIKSVKCLDYFHPPQQFIQFFLKSCNRQKCTKLHIYRDLKYVLNV